MKIDRKSFGLLAKEDKLIPHLDRAIGEGEFAWTFDHEPKQGDDAWHPSSDCTPTLYALYQYASGNLKEKPISASLNKTFAVGHFWHRYVQHLLLSKLEFCDEKSIERKGCKVWDDTASCHPYWWATGSGDVAPVEIPKHGSFLLDIKTMNGHDFRSPDIPLWTKDKWECQINIYMDFFDLERAIILGIEKDSPHEFKEFEFERNQPLIDTIYMKWKLISACLKDGICPPEEEVVELPIGGPIRG